MTDGNLDELFWWNDVCNERLISEFKKETELGAAFLSNTFKDWYKWKQEEDD